MIPKKFCQLIKELAKRHDIDKVYDGDKAYMTSKELQYTARHKC